MREQILSLIKDAVSDLNEELQYDSLADPSEDTVLFGGDDGIDSISLVRLVVDVEMRVKEELGQSTSLTDERAMSARHSPYRSVGALVDLVAGQLGD